MPSSLARIEGGISAASWYRAASTNGLIWIDANEEPSAVDSRLCLSSHNAGLLNQVPRHVIEGIGELDVDSAQSDGHAR